MLRPAFGVAAAVALIGVMLALPAPRRPAATTATAATSVTGLPPPVTQVWPGAHTFAFPALLPDGSTFTPITVLDRDVVVGGITDATTTRNSLATITATGTVRIVKTFLAGDQVSVAAVAATPDALFWMQTTADANGATATASLWRAGRNGGPVRLVTAKAGRAVLNNSGYDLQAVGGRLYWVTAADGGAADWSMPSAARVGSRSHPMAGT
jgi:hypothetical protein